jgi:mannose/cellobiose epimerase-like protein (N-acyl-D-glucosamine 2-epimerase family)
VERLNAYRDWITGRALPTWSSIGFDPVAGRFRERLDLSGSPLDVPHRAMVQARQIYVFSHACQLGWFEEGGALAERAMASLLREYGEVSEHEASFAFSIDGRGRVVSSVRDAYTHAFVLFAIAWLHRVNGDSSLLQLADKVDAFVQAHLFDARHGGMFDSFPTTVREKRQNPLMHLLEAYLALERSAPGRGYLDRAGELVDVFTSHLFDSGNGVLLEHFAEDWSPHPDAGMRDVVEPGHHFEWVWLLREYERLSGAELGRVSDVLYTVARDHGVADDGLIHDEIATGRSVRRRSHRVWPHTEAIKAAMARHADGDEHALPFAESMAAALLDHFLDKPFSGGWIDHIGQTGLALVDYVPASTLYHLFFAAAEAAHGDCAPDVAGHEQTRTIR